jgi:carotenoid cleavage dioxygenase-like enzyme
MTETPLPIAFDPQTLAQAGVVRYTDGHDAPVSTAHPYVEPDRGRTITHLTDFGRQCQYHVCAIDPGTARRETLATLDVEQPSYMHSFGMTEHYVVLAEWPLVVDPLDLLLAGKPFIENFRWAPARGTRFRILRKRDGAEVATCTADAAFAFHHVNAFERDGTIVCDVAAYPDAQIIDDLYLNRLRAPDSHPATGRLTRYRLPLSGGPVAAERPTDAMLELPRIDARRTGRPYRVVYGVGTRDPASFTDQLVKIDPETGAVTTWYEDGCFPGEPVFVPHPEGTAENAGLVLSVVLDAAADTSFLLVLDAATYAEVARATVPHAIPFGFHGRFFSTAV